MNTREHADALEPRFLVACEDSSVDHKPVEISKTPWDQAKPSDAEKGVEDLGVDLDPYAPRRVDVVAVWSAHGRSSIAEKQEQHATPGHHVKAVYGDAES